MQNEQTDKNWEAFLTPETVKRKMLLTGVYSYAYEQLKSQIIEPIKSFYKDEFSQNSLDSESYQNRVMKGSKSVLYASLNWLKEIEAIDPKDIALFEKLKDRRNNIAHELTAFLTTADQTEEALIEDLIHVRALMLKLEQWWFFHVELELNPAYDNLNHEEFDLTKVQGMGSMTLDMLHKVVLSTTESEATELLKAWKKGKNANY